VRQLAQHRKDAVPFTDVVGTCSTCNTVQLMLRYDSLGAGRCKVIQVAQHEMKMRPIYVVSSCGAPNKQDLMGCGAFLYTCSVIGGSRQIHNHHGSRHDAQCRVVKDAVSVCGFTAAPSASSPRHRCISLPTACTMQHNSLAPVLKLSSPHTQYLPHACHMQYTLH
jgi:hypothetical protein